MNPTLKPLASLFAGLALFAAAGHAAHAQALPSTRIDSIAAVVDETVILRSELDRAVANITAQYSRQPEQLPPRDILEQQVLERLILLHLQVQRASDSGIRIADAELQQAVSSIASQNNLTVEQLRQRLAADGLSFDEFRANLRDEITVQRLRQRYLQSSLQISEAEVDQALASQQGGGEEMHLANIQVNLSEGATPDEIAAARTRIDGIKSMVERGEIDFRSAAIRYSQAQNALDGGEIGWRTIEAVPPVFANLLQQMQPGQITEPVRGQSGFQIVQLVEKRAPQPQVVTQYRASDIMVSISEIVNAEAARQKIESLHARVLAGEDFAKVAKEASENVNTRNAGGDMGWFVADQWGTAIAAQIAQLKDGDVSPIFQSEVGFHFIKRTGSRQQDVTADNQRARARELIGQRKGEEAYERFLRQLRSDAYIETRLGGA